MAFEINFDGIVGPTHNYSGLSFGNTASMSHQLMVSNPKAAALQGLEKMKFLADLGIKQAVLPPQERPHIPTLKQLGFSGSDFFILQKVSQTYPELLANCSSAAAMWAANAATVSPSADTSNHRVHFTPANLSSKFHRSIEPLFTSSILKKIFADPNHFVHHPPLPAGNYFADEGAANHNRFCHTYGEQGVELFVFGRHALTNNPFAPKIYPARQTFEACQALARMHGLDENKTLFVQQNPHAIDQGVFHNDVISVANEKVFFYHEMAFIEMDKMLKRLRQLCPYLVEIDVKSSDVPLQDAVSSYLFNSQIVTLSPGKMALIAPTECFKTAPVKQFLDQLIASKKTPIHHVYYQNLRESMANGGGPACLRLRVVLTEAEWEAIHPHVIFTNELYQMLKNWIQKHYRDSLKMDDLHDPQLLDETRRALDELSSILRLGSIYPFQQG
jgi:succinylarginine dihydrolase